MKAGPGIAALALTAALAFVFVDQVRDSGFARGHRGWVSAHTLAIAVNATPANGLVGYALSLVTEGGREPYYFDRYPVFFTAALHAALRVAGPDKARQIEFARQAMNIVYALTVVAAVVLLVELGIPVEMAIAASALAATALTMVEYRDMVHFDQPAVLGGLVLLWGIAAWIRGRPGRVVLLATVFAVTAGRGYASFTVLGLWWLLDSLRAVFAPAPDARDAGRITRQVLLGVPARACLLGAAVAASCLAYNIHAEARMRGVSWSEVSIVGSAARRLSLDEGFNRNNEGRLAWSNFFEIQQKNLANSVLPWTRGTPLRGRPVLRGLLVAVVAAVVLGFALTRQGSLRIPWLLMGLAGPLWLTVMRNLTAFHPYTAVFLFPVGLAFFAAVLHVVPRRWCMVPALAACVLLVSCTHQRNRELSRDRRAAVADTADMERIAAILKPGDDFAAHQWAFRGVPFAVGFYLPGRGYVVEGRTSLVLSRSAEFRGENLTPTNHGIFLYRALRPWRAKSPMARHVPNSAVSRWRAERTGSGLPLRPVPRR